MKIESLIINHSLKNGTLSNLKQNPDIISFILAALDHGFTIKMPCSITAHYNKVIIGCHTSGDDTDRFIWITKTNVKEVLKKFKVCDFRFDNLEVIRGALYYDKQFICTTT